MAEKKLTAVIFFNPRNYRNKADCAELSAYIQTHSGHDAVWNSSVQPWDDAELAAYIRLYSNVAEVWDPCELPWDNAEKLAKKISAKKISRIVIAGELPGIIKSYVARAMMLAGESAEQVWLADFHEHGASDLQGISSDKAKAVLLAAFYQLPFEMISVPAELPVNPTTLVIGGGIAGSQASLEIAEAGLDVYLVERSGTIGGHMAMFDKTFPTLDCAACILTPKMVEVGQHPHIKLRTYCEVKEVTGVPGNYTVKILKKARMVNLSTCIGCGTCTEKCPVNVFSEFDSGTTMRKAIYIPFPQAVPNKYLIDVANCTKITANKCGVCAKVCPVADCIDYNEKDTEEIITVGNIIVATGFKTFDATRVEQYGYGKYPNVLTSLEFERLINASGPTGGEINFRVQDKKQNWIFTQTGDSPRKVGVIHCVGSRDENHNSHCSKVCCMYSLKLAHLVKEKLPDAEVYEYYIDMRAFGKGYEEFYERIREEGIHMIRGKTAKIEESGKKLKLRGEDMEGGKLLEQEMDMVILAVGLEPREDAGEIARMIGLDTEKGWFREANQLSDPVGTSNGGIYVAGVCQGPKDIPDTVAQASAAASRVIQCVIRGKVAGNQNGVPLSEIETMVKQFSMEEIA
ncbi:MAG: CoB--CoM heterodisulfide reductase iron-sulfur subunit A family protein [Bacteroidota bacterium]